ncbi:hypothetical protein BDZ45DRAFT_780286 [Acephala macrosclerotiorum]|nr:hypothetical protein BDZ45DRAFT_780286 [Acephala macrosclerotiorum]
MICSFKNNYSENVITSCKNAFYYCNQFFIVWIINVNTHHVRKNNNDFSSCNANLIARFIEIVNIFVQNSPLVPAPLKILEMTFDFFAIICF